MSVKTKSIRKYAFPLDRFDRTSVSAAGGKGANLGELIRAGFPVPPGFVITTAGYDFFMKANPLEPLVAELLVKTNSGQQESVRATSDALREAFERAHVPEELALEIAIARGDLDCGSVAVRSSATLEDLPGSTFAGQQETFLNVTGKDRLLKAIKECWASLWSERAISYRFHNKADQGSVKIAVVVQALIDADVSGVMFTADPVTSDRDSMVIDANPGLGEAVVGGLVTPDHYEVEKRTNRITAARPGNREMVIVPEKGGGVKRITGPSAENRLQALGNEEIRRLAQIGKRIERHYGIPQDIEWCWIANGRAKGRFFILQARPMTALADRPAANSPMKILAPILAEMWPERPTPLDMTTFTGAIEKAIGTLLASILGKNAPDPETLLEEEDGIVTRLNIPAFSPSPAILVSIVKALYATRMYDVEKWKEDSLVREITDLWKSLESREISSSTWGENIALTKECLSLVPRIMDLRIRYFPGGAVHIAKLLLLLKLAGSADLFGTLLSGVETKTSETNERLESLADIIRSDSGLADLFSRHAHGELGSLLRTSEAGQRFIGSLASFLDEYGHRESSLVISQPAWKDSEENVLGILKMLASGNKAAQDTAAWERARDRILEDTMLGRKPFRKSFLRSLLKSRGLVQLREDSHFLLTLVQPTIRRVALELGRRLVHAGALEIDTDVFFLRFDELESAGSSRPPQAAVLSEIRATVAARKAKYESLLRTPMFDFSVFGTGETGTEAGILLTGSPGSPGIASGRVRIVRNISEFGTLEPGEVLVAQSTNPSWTPLFMRAVAVVADTGGAASHAAIVAREYGIPAVMGTMTATRVLENGQIVRVNGTKGTVSKGENLP